MTHPEINDPLRNNVKNNDNIGPISGLEVPRFAGLSTFARLPAQEDPGDSVGGEFTMRLPLLPFHSLEFHTAPQHIPFLDHQFHFP